MNEKKRDCFLIIIPIILISSFLSSEAFFPSIKSYVIQQEQVLQTSLLKHHPLGEEKLMTYSNHAAIQHNKNNSNKYAILNFDDVFKGQYEYAKPILDKYYFKATFFVVCDYVGNKNNRMSWDEMQSLYKEGHDIQSHSMTHKDLDKMSQEMLVYEIEQSKQCLLDKGINSTIFAYPRASGWDNATVVNEVAKHYELARTGFSPVTFLKCDGWIHDSNSHNDCRTFFDNGTLTLANQYSMMGWMHTRVLGENFGFENNSRGNDNINIYLDSASYYGNYSQDNFRTFDNFVKVVNIQKIYNKGNEEINAIPIITYHNVVNGNAPFESGKLPITTDKELFEHEMKYLHDNGFNVITLKDIGYNPDKKYLFIRER
jgi:hypothetical protein